MMTVENETTTTEERMAEGLVEGGLMELDPKKCHDHPQNPRIPNAARVEELAGLIAEHGQTQPGLVRTLDDAKKGYQVILGHKRRAACEKLKIPFRAFVVELTDEETLAVMLSDKRAFDDPDALLESEAVAALLEKLGSVQRVSEQLGKPVRWCAARANLKNLSAKTRARMAKGGEKGMRDWPIEWLEQWALLDLQAQDELLPELDRYYCRSREQLDRFLAEQLHVLRKAPWNVDDPDLLPRAGSCTDCPKTSSRSPGLFADPNPEGKPNPKGETCRDGVCWAAKHDAWVAKKAREIREEDKDAVLIKSYGAEPPKAFAKEKLAEPYDFEPAKKGERGARKGIVVSGDKKGEVGYFKRRGAEPRIDHRTGKPKKKPSEMSFAEKIADSKRKVLQRRGALELELIGTELEKVAEPPTLGILVALATTFGVERTYGTDSWRHGNVKDLEGLKKTFTLEGRAQQLALWVGVQNVLLAEIALGHLEDPKCKLAVASWLCEVLAGQLPECCLETIQGLALHEVPDPAWWNSKPTGKKGAKAKTHASASAEAMEQSDDERARDEDTPDREGGDTEALNEDEADAALDDGDPLE